MSLEAVRAHQAKHGFRDPLAPTEAEKLARTIRDTPEGPKLERQRQNLPPQGVSGTQDSEKSSRGLFRAKSGKGPNKTEKRFLDILEARKRAGEILDYRYEGIRLKWGTDPKTGASMHYKADVAVFRVGAKPLLIEIKGGYRTDRDVVRFRGCRAEWSAHFDFEMHVWDKGQWTQAE